MQLIQRIAAVTLFSFLLLFTLFLSVIPFTVIAIFEQGMDWFKVVLQESQAANSTNFMIGQAAIGIITILLFGMPLWIMITSRRPRGAIIYTTDGRAAEIDTNSISRRLDWHLGQIAEINNVIPLVRARGAVVDIRLEMEVDPDTDISMKTDEVVLLTHEIIEDEIGLKLGRLDVRLRCAPFDAAFA